jgi:hypothetical protein
MSGSLLMVSCILLFLIIVHAVDVVDRWCDHMKDPKDNHRVRILDLVVSCTELDHFAEAQDDPLALCV